MVNDQQQPPPGKQLSSKPVIDRNKDRITGSRLANNKNTNSNLPPPPKNPIIEDPVIQDPVIEDPIEGMFIIL